MVLPPNDWQKMVGMAVSVDISCLDLEEERPDVLAGKQK
jgi:hypothetical protein